MRRLVASLGFTTAVLLGLAGSKSFAAFQVKPGVLSNETAPGTSSQFDRLYRWATSADGGIMFVASLKGGGATSANNSGIWIGPADRSQPFALVAREGETIPGASGFRFRDAVDLPTMPRLSSGMRGAFNVGVTNGGSATNAVALLAGAPGAWNVLDLGTTETLWMEAATNGRVIAFVGDFSNANRFVLADGTNLTTYAAVGAHPPGTSSATTYSSLGSPQRRLLNASGQLMFGAFVNDPDQPAASSGVWYGTADNLQLLLRRGFASPIINGEVFGSASSFNINAAGHIALAGTNFAADRRLWAGTKDSMQLIAQAGQSVPGVPSATFTSFLVRDMNAIDQVIFDGTLAGSGVTGDNDSAIFLASGNTIQMIARQGDLAPGAGGARFAGFTKALNDFGDIAFRADLDSGTTGGLWILPAGGSLQLLACEGVPFEVAPGDVRMPSFIQYLGGSTGSHGEAANFTADRRFMFEIYFVDQTVGIFSVQLPEPSAVLSLALISLTSLRR